MAASIGLGLLVLLSLSFVSGGSSSNDAHYVVPQHASQVPLESQLRSGVVSEAEPGVWQPLEDENPFAGKPFWTQDLAIGTSIIFLGAAVCCGAGIGGGGVFVPTYILLLGLSSHWALPLSQVSILGVGIGSSIYLIPQSHPTLPRRLIDLSLASLLEPATLLGTIPGVYLNVMFPAYIITALLTVLLTYTSYVTISAGLRQFHAEQEAREKLRKRVSVRMNSLTENTPPSTSRDLAPCAVVPIESKEADLRTPFLESEVPEPKEIAAATTAATTAGGTEKEHDGVWKWYQLLGLMGATLTLAIAQGSKTLFDCHSAGYWLITVACIPPIAALAWFFAMQPPKRGTYPWLWSVFGLIAGLAAGFLGIGGGMIKSPLMLQMGTTPQVATATASFMILFTSMATVFQFFLLGRLELLHACWYGGAGLLGALVGQFLLARIIRYYGRQSFVSLFVGFIIVSCAIAMVVTNILSILNHTASMGFNSPCAIPR
eukprot:gnl/Spiro4/18100_TR9670_c0_g1_i1.p1 gnl/Spiro4/18100_TR9670_c0_g1~~gnl/Spiro4/18100_TR9670_c0_g1_i1.p1  ORF type:complete len:488 (-),score=95.67 gnl/Spiro4/18100_TR9670_c0_g1_i1:59-1522(-)